MGVVCSWGGKKWIIDAKTLTALNELTLTRELDVEEGDVKDGKAPTTVKGYKAQTLTTTHRVSFSAGSDPRAEFEAWQALLGKRSGFHVEGTRISAPALILDSVEFMATAISNTGEFLAAEIILTFSEDVSFAPAPAVATELYVGDPATPETTPGYKPNGSSETKSAYNVRPSASAAETKLGG